MKLAQKIKKITSIIALSCVSLSLSAQTEGVSIASYVVPPDPSAMLDIQATDKGVLIPRLSEAQKNAILSPKESLLIYQTNATKGFYYWDGINSWIELRAVGGTMLKVTFVQMLAMSANLTDIDRGLFVFVTDGILNFCGGGIQENVYGVWSFYNLLSENTDGCKWLRLDNGLSGDPCVSCAITNNPPSE